MEDTMPESSLAASIDEIAAIFARGVCRFWKRGHSQPVQQEQENSSDISLNQLAIPAEKRPCVHSKTPEQRSISHE